MKNLLILFVVSIIGGRIHAQNAKSSLTATPPVYKVTWGGFPQGKINAEQFKKILDSPLVVKDAKGVGFPITRFRINYIFISTYKDSESQMVKSIQDLRVFDFYDTSTLSELWRSSIRDNTKKGDTVLINNIIVKMKNGKKTMVADYKVSVE